MKRIMKGNKVINKVVLIPIGEISPNRAQPRQVFDTAELESLSSSIRENGILQPLTVRQNYAGKYELIAGERRLKASKMAGLTSVPCIIMETDERQSAVFALLENMQRSDLNYFEEAQAIQSLIFEWNVTQEEAAKRLGKSQSTLANKLRLLRFEQPQREKIFNAGLTERHARALLKLDDPMEIDKAVYYIAAKKLNVKQTEKYIEQLQQTQSKHNHNIIPVIKDVRLFINTINKAIDTMKLAGVQATAERVDGKDCIEYIVKIPKA